MLTEVRKITVTGFDVAKDLCDRKQISKGQFAALKRKPEASKKIDMYTVLPEFVKGWTKYAREVSVYESVEQYVADIEGEYTYKHYMRR